MKLDLLRDGKGPTNFAAGLLILAVWLFLNGLVLLLNVSNDGATKAGAIATWVTSFITFAITSLAAAFVLLQVAAAKESTQDSLRNDRRQRRLWATLQVCDRYDADPQLARAVQFLRLYHPYTEDRIRPPGASKAFPIEAPPGDAVDVQSRLHNEQYYTACVELLLNYFDSIAIGIQQGFYVARVCREHLGEIMLGWLDEFEANDKKVFAQVMENYFPSTLRLRRHWKRQARKRTIALQFSRE